MPAPCPSDLSDAERAALQPLIPPAETRERRRRRSPKRVHASTEGLPARQPLFHALRPTAFSRICNTIGGGVMRLRWRNR